MGDLKSLFLLWEDLAKNHRYQPYISSKDIEVFRCRAEHEGLTFLTNALPSLGKAIDNFLSTTIWKCPGDFSSVDQIIDFGSHLYDDFFDWSSEEESVGLEIGRLMTLAIPKFLGNAIKNALEGDSLAVDCVRQLSYVFYKLEVQHDESTVDQFLEKFRQTDSNLGDLLDLEDNFTSKIVNHMAVLIKRILMNEDPLDIRPCHGSGSTACHTENWEKWHKLRYIKKLDAVYPYSDYFFFNFSHLADELDKLKDSNEVLVPRARVVLVPKDSRGPRIISCEPCEMMFIQQGLMRRLYAILEKHQYTTGQINFLDQSVNRSLAKTSSIDGIFATIDLSDASDRVSWELVKRVFPDNWVRCLEACRSEETILPDRSVVKLNKFAPMGSACCFPVEALVFWACAQAVLYEQVHGSFALPRDRKEEIVTKIPVYVYGDDIITPANFAAVVIRGLECVGLLANANKSFWRGPFRESCGGDYHNGYDVTPVRVKKYLSSQGTGVCTGADLANSFIAKFGYESSLPLIQVIEQGTEYPFPRTELSIPGTIRTSPSASNDALFDRRYNKYLQRIEYRILSLTAKVKLRQPPNWGELFRKELQRENEADTTSDEELHSHWSKPVDAKARPGWYADVHSARQYWSWAWLG